MTVAREVLSRLETPFSGHLDFLALRLNAAAGRFRILLNDDLLI